MEGPGARAGAGADPAPGRLFAAAVGLASLVAVGLAVRGLLRQPIWLDEAYSIAVARQPAAAIPPSLADESGPPLYYLLLHLWLTLFGDGPAAARSLSVLCAALLVPATARLGRRLGGDRAGVLAGFLAAATPMLVQFAQEARMYTLLPLLAVLASERLLAWLEEGRRGALAAHSLFLAAAFYAHNWGLLLLPAAAGATLLYPRDRRRGAGLAWLGALLLYAPWVPVVRAQASAASYQFIGMVQSESAWALPFRSLVLFGSGLGAAGGEARSLLSAPGGPLAALLWAVLSGAAILGLLPPEEGRSGAAPRRDRLAALILGTVPLLEAAVVSGVYRPIYLVGRYEVMVLPALLGLVAAGAASLSRGRVFAVVSTAWVLGLAALSCGFTGRIQRRFPEPLMADRLAPAIRAGDRVVFTGLYRAALDYHLRRAGARYEAASFPPDVADHLGWFYDGLYDPGDPALAAAARGDCPAAGRRTWVVASATRTSDLLLRTLAACARLSAPFSALGPPFTALLLAEPGNAVP